jgi:hypothetical protein
MTRYKKENMNRFRMTECAKCGEPVSDRKSWAVPPARQSDEGQYVLAKSATGDVVTRKALPRVHRGKCPK